MQICKDCQGTGRVLADPRYECFDCNGTGIAPPKYCVDCDGYGDCEYDGLFLRCKRCGGTGKEDGKD